MHYSKPITDETTIAQDEAQIQALRDLRDSMVGNLYPHIVSEDIVALERQLEKKKKRLAEEYRAYARVSVTPILEMYYRCLEKEKEA